MPYIPNENDQAANVRPDLDPEIAALARKIDAVAAGFGYDGAYAGLLNYCVTCLAALTTPARRVEEAAHLLQRAERWDREIHLVGTPNQPFYILGAELRDLIMAVLSSDKDAK